MALAKSIYAIPCWTRVVALVRDHAGLQAALGCVGETPSEWACYRFARKLREHGNMLDVCIASVIEALREQNPDIGTDVAIDASDMPAYANGQRYVSKGGRERAPEEYSDPDATWGHRSAVSTRKGGGFYGYRLHLLADTATDLPLAWAVETAKLHETNTVAPLLERVRSLGIDPETVAMDKGYDNARVYRECEERNCHPIIPLRKSLEVRRGAHLPPYCEHGEWRFAGADYSREATKWRCPTGNCKPASVWIKADEYHPLTPRETLRWKALYRRRASVERAFGRLKNDGALTPLRVRGIERVRLHANLTILAQLGRALTRAQTIPAAA